MSKAAKNPLYIDPEKHDSGSDGHQSIKNKTMPQTTTTPLYIYPGKRGSGSDHYIMYQNQKQQQNTNPAGKAFIYIPRTPNTKYMLVYACFFFVFFFIPIMVLVLTVINLSKTKP